MGKTDSTDGNDFQSFIEEAKAFGGSEPANYQLFVERLCGHFKLPCPDLAQEANEQNDYVFERRVDFKHGDGTTTAGRMPDEIAASFDGRNTAKRKAGIVKVIEILVATGAARTGQLEGATRYFLPR